MGLAPSIAAPFGRCSSDCPGAHRRHPSMVSAERSGDRHWTSMRDARQQLGREGESLAERFLRSRGYQIVARNVRSPSGELDLIADDGGVLVFVEVKARRTGAFGGTSYAVDPRKQSRIVKQAA